MRKTGWCGWLAVLAAASPDGCTSEVRDLPSNTESTSSGQGGGGGAAAGGTTSGKGEGGDGGAVNAGPTWDAYCDSRSAKACAGVDAAKCKGEEACARSQLRDAI